MRVNLSFFDRENMKKTTSKVAHNQPQFFFSLLPTGPKAALISISVLLKWLPLYNDFVWCMRCLHYFLTAVGQTNSVQFIDYQQKIICKFKINRYVHFAMSVQRLSLACTNLHVLAFC